MALNANLTVKNISSSVAGNNIINITRNLTGSGNLIVDTYNNVASGAVAFSNGRVQLSGDNTAWTGNLVVAKGTFQFSGNNSFVPAAGSITLGTTSDAFGAGLGFNQLATDVNLSNAITVATGGVRLIRNNAGPGSTNNITLNGALNLAGDITLDHAGLGASNSLTVAGNATGAGGLNVTYVGPNPVAGSSVRLTGNNTYTGNTTVGTGASLVVNSASGNGIGDSSAVTLVGTGTLTTTTAETIGSLASSGTDGVLVLTSGLTTGGTNASTSYGGTSSGAGGLTKVGSGTQTLTGTNSYTGGTTVTAGTLVIAGTGSINNTSGLNVSNGATFKYNSSTAFTGGVSVSAGGTLGGNGTVGAITGAGTVAPGNSPGILTATSAVLGTGGQNFKFELSSVGAPTYSNAAASVNDVLHLTGGSPLSGTANSSNVFDIYLGVSSLANGDTFQGGIFTDATASFLSQVNGGTYNYFVLGNGLGSNLYNGSNYYTLAQYNTLVGNTFSFGLSTLTVPTAAFGTGTVSNGVIMQFSASAIPEPQTYAMMLGGAAMLILMQRRRRIA
jgi:autotransporter-associated beta strand protein